jgi:hypothetical protein
MGKSGDNQKVSVMFVSIFFKRNKGKTKERIRKKRKQMEKK